MNRLSVSNIAGCAAARILSSSNSDSPPVISTNARRKSLQNANLLEHNSSTQSTAASTSSSVRANTSPSLPGSGTAQLKSGYSVSASSSSIIVQSEPAQSQAVLVCQCSTSSYIHQTNYPAAVYLSDGENNYFDKAGFSHLFFDPSNKNHYKIVFLIKVGWIVVVPRPFPRMFAVAVKEPDLLGKYIELLCPPPEFVPHFGIGRVTTPQNFFISASFKAISPAPPRLLLTDFKPLLSILKLPFLVQIKQNKNFSAWWKC